MGWFGDRIEKLRRMPNPYLFMHITGKFLFGVGLGILLAIWLPIWTGWLFIIAALLIAIPSARIILGGKTK